MSDFLYGLIVGIGLTVLVFVPSTIQEFHPSEDHLIPIPYEDTLLSELIIEMGYEPKEVKSFGHVMIHDNTRLWIMFEHDDVNYLASFKHEWALGAGNWGFKTFYPLKR